jgi:hypothetical protein
MIEAILNQQSTPNAGIQRIKQEGTKRSKEERATAIKERQQTISSNRHNCVLDSSRFSMSYFYNGENTADCRLSNNRSAALQTKPSNQIKNNSFYNPSTKKKATQ